MCTINPSDYLDLLKHTVTRAYPVFVLVGPIEDGHLIPNRGVCDAFLKESVSLTVQFLVQLVGIPTVQGAFTKTTYEITKLV